MLLEIFRRVVNDSIGIGLVNDASSLRRLSLLSYNKRLQRKLWCGKCRIVMDRDMVAAVNLAWRGRVRFARSRPPILLEAQGGAVEAMKGNPTPTVIPGVDAPKLTDRPNI